MLRPEHFDDAAYDIPPVLWTVDDVWLSGMLARRDIPIWLEANQPDPLPSQAEAVDGLAEQVIDGADRRAANQAAIDHMRKAFGVWS